MRIVDSEYGQAKWQRNLKVCVCALCLLLSSQISHALVILQYHHVSTDTPYATSVSPQRFKEHMNLVAASGYQVVSLASMLETLQKGQALPDKTVLITFDDGSRSVLEFALPVLKEKGWPFVVFVSSEPVSQQVAETLSWQELRQLAESGAAIANHGVTHSHMVRLMPGETNNQWRSRMIHEIESNQQRIQDEVGQDFKAFAYPYGEYSQALLELVRDKGYVGFGQHSGAPALRDIAALPRFPFGGDYGDAKDFITKLKALPMPYTAVRYFGGDGKALKDGVLAPNEQRPELRFSFATADIVAGLACYASRQGVTEKRVVAANEVSIKAKKPLMAGRSRYNCTAPSKEAGRFYWHSSPFLKPNSDGSWAPEPK